MNLNYIEKKYINLMSVQLERFKWKKDDLANVRCPVCGDSQKSKSKARGYFYLSKHRRYRFKCQNCGINWSAGQVIEYVSPTLHAEYRLEYLKELVEGGTIKPKKQDTPTVSSPAPTRESLSELGRNLQPITTLPVFHEAYKYITQERMIPKSRLDGVFYTPNLQLLLNHLASPKYDYRISDIESKYPQDERIIFPSVNSNGRLIGLSARALPSSAMPSSIRYITVKLSDTEPAIYGLNRIDPKKRIYCVEGQVDSLYLPNSVAIGGSGLLLLDRTLSPTEHGLEITYVHDNQPRNKEIVREVERSVNGNHSVVIWQPQSEMKYGKDIGTMVEYGMGLDDLLWEIQRRTFQGIEAKLEFDQWKKV